MAAQNFLRGESSVIWGSYVEGMPPIVHLRNLLWELRCMSANTTTARKKLERLGLVTVRGAILLRPLECLDEGLMTNVSIKKKMVCP